MLTSPTLEKSRGSEYSVKLEKTVAMPEKSQGTDYRTFDQAGEILVLRYWAN